MIKLKGSASVFTALVLTDLLIMTQLPYGCVMAAYLRSMGACTSKQQ